MGKNELMGFDDQTFEALLVRFRDLYVSYRTRFVLCTPSGHILIPKSKKQGYTPLTDNALRNHLRRQYAVGVFAGESGSKFLCFDVDDGSKETVQMICDSLEVFGIAHDRIYVSYSGSKGYHVEVFFDTLVATEQLYQLYRWVLERDHLNEHKVEFRPTSKVSIKLPLSIHSRTGNVCWYVNRDTLIPIESAEYLFEIEPVSARSFGIMVERNIRDVSSIKPLINPASRTNAAGRATDNTRNLGTTLKDEGTRHNMMRNMAVYMRYQGRTKEGCEKELLAWYETQNKDMVHSTYEAVVKDIHDIVEWAFSDCFTVNRAYPKGEVMLDEKNAHLILAQRSRCARRIVFLLLTRCKDRQYKINYAKIAEAIHVSERVTTQTILRLEKEGVLEVKRGKRYNLGDKGFAAESNSYTVRYEQSDKEEPGYTIRIKDLMKDVTRCYFSALLALLPKQEVEKLLLRNEREEYACYLEELACERNTEKWEA